MDTFSETTKQTSAKFKTTLYLTEQNRKRLEAFGRGRRTKLINQAIAEKLDRLEQEEMQKRLLDALENSMTTPSNGISTEDALHEIRVKEAQNLVVE